MLFRKTMHTPGALLLLCSSLLLSPQLCRAYDMVDPVFTPYFPNGTVDYAQVPLYAQLCVDNGVDVVLLGGSTAEWSSLTSDERLSLLHAWRNALDGIDYGKKKKNNKNKNETGHSKQSPTKPTILFHSGDVSVANAKYLTSQAAARGADEILIVSPMVMRPATLPDLVDVLQDIAAQSSLPMFYYHYPALYGVDFNMHDLLTMAKRIPTLKGVKYIDPDMKVLASAAGVADAGFTLYNNDPLLAGLAVGSKGAISYTTIFPLARQMQQAYAKGDFAGAQQAQLSILAYDAIIGQFGGKPAARSLPGLFDPRIKIGPPRSPLKVISDDDLAGLKAALQSAGFLPKSEL